MHITGFFKGRSDIQKKNEYKKIGIYYLFGNLFNKGISFLTIPIFTRILSTYDYGIINTYSSWVGITAMIMGMALHMGIRGVYTDTREKTYEAMSTVTTFTMLLFLSSIILMIPVLLVRGTSRSGILFVICLFDGFCNAVLSDYMMFLMMSFRYKQRTLLMVLPSLITTTASIALILIMADRKYLGKIMVGCFVNLVVCVTILIYIYRKHKIGINRDLLKYCLRISVPLIIHALALNILSQSDRTMITALTDASQTGIYSLVYNFSMVASVVVNSMEGLWVPWFTQKLKSNERATINELSEVYQKIMTLIFVVIILCSPEILKIISTEEYWEGVNIIPPLVLSNYMTFSYMLYVNVEQFYKKTVRISINTLLAAVSNIVLNIIFIPLYGYTAAAYTTLASYTFSLLLHVIYARKIEPELLKPLGLVQQGLLLLGVVVLYYLSITNATVRWICAIIFSLTFCYVNRDYRKYIAMPQKTKD